MKLIRAFIAILQTRLAFGRVAQRSASDINTITESLATPRVKGSQTDWARFPANDNISKVNFDPDNPQRFTEQQREQIWCKAVSKGSTLSQAALLDETEARVLLSWPYVKSPWEGDLKAELRRWGYLDDEQVHKQADIFCDFEVHHQMTRSFGDLHIDPRSAAKGGPNRCYNLKHRDGPAVHRNTNGALPPTDEQFYTVDGREYRSTDAYATIGINTENGIIFLLNRESPEKAADWAWKPDPVTPDTLPKLRSSSDLMYGLWHRQTSDSTRKSIKMFMSVTITNEETGVIISRALNLKDPELVFDVPDWPGKTFTLGSDDAKEHDAALALLGSPNGLGVSYFLIQHKEQLGGTKFIWKVQVFKGDSGTYPQILFYVDPGEVQPAGGPEDIGKTTNATRQLTQVNGSRAKL